MARHLVLLTQVAALRADAVACQRAGVASGRRRALRRLPARPALTLALAALVLAASTTPAPAATKPGKVQCAKAERLVQPKSGPRLCLPKKLPGLDQRDAAGKALVKRALKVLARERLPKLRTPKKAKRRHAKARAAAEEPRIIARDGNTTVSEWTEDGRRMQAIVREDDSMGPNVEGRLRDVITWGIKPDGSGAALGLGLDDRTDRCPSATGDVRSKAGLMYAEGASRGEHGKRHWTLVTARYEGDVLGHVGVGAKAETFDVSLRGTLEMKSGIEHATTHKLLKHHPTRTYRVALDRKGLPIDVSTEDIVKVMFDDARIAAPGGFRLRGEDAKLLAGLWTMAGSVLALAREHLRDGDRRWFDERRCAKVAHTSSPEKVKKGGTATWTAKVLAADGTPVADARWTASSGCGALSPATAAGATATFTVTDQAGQWGPKPYAPACIKAEATSPAGRTGELDHTIPPEDAPKPATYRFDIEVDYDEDIGGGVAPTIVTGTASAIDVVDDQVTQSPGAGEYQGTEWDGTFENPCGADMQRKRAFHGTFDAAAKATADGLVTLAVSARERAAFTWIFTVPIDGGTYASRVRNPFCGQADARVDSVFITVKSTRLA